jgi:hypothetical protein
MHDASSWLVTDPASKLPVMITPSLPSLFKNPNATLYQDLLSSVPRLIVDSVEIVSKTSFST